MGILEEVNKNNTYTYGELKEEDVKKAFDAVSNNQIDTSKDIVLHTGFMGMVDFQVQFESSVLTKEELVEAYTRRSKDYQKLRMDSAKYMAVPEWVVNLCNLPKRIRHWWRMRKYVV